MILQGNQPSLSQQLQTSFAAFSDLLPKMLLALAVIIAGYILAKVMERVVDGLLRRIGLNRLLDRGGVLQAMERSGARVNPTRLIGRLVFWLAMFVVLLTAANMLGLESVAAVVGNLVRYIPSVIAAIVIIVAGVLLGQFVGGLIATSLGSIRGGRALSRAGQAGVIVIATFMALQELGIATDIVTTAFAILFGAAALAIAIAFGLGNRDLAGEITRDWYERYRKERDEAIAREAAEEEDDDSLGSTPSSPPTPPGGVGRQQ